MAGKIPQHFIDELLTRIDIVDVIERRVPLRKAGREFSACCPFHNEKSPSFTVSPEKQFYHCFGCGAHGSAISFLMEYENQEFVDAIDELAQQAGLTVPRESNFPQQTLDTSSLDALEQAAKFYRQQLKQAVPAVDYLKSRGLSGETATLFQIGFAPSGWDSTIQALKAKGISEQKLLDAGLVIKRDNGGYYDRFRDRIMFPIRDRRGRVIAFGGRVLATAAATDKHSPKYLNSPETSLFHKGKELYGLYEARQANRHLDKILVVEGYMDVVSLSQAGINYAVATLGTATTPEHLERIFRVVSEVVFCFDGDRAGRQAAWRALTNALDVIREGRQIRFMFLPQGEDPDTMVQQEGQQAFEQRMQQALPYSTFFFEGLSNNLDLSTIDGRSGLVERAKPLLLKLSPGVFQSMMLQELAKLTHMSAEKLSTLIFPTATEQPKTRSKKIEKAGLSPVRQAIRLLIEFPKLAQGVDLKNLQGLNVPGAALLLELVEFIQYSTQQQGSTNTGAILEHWRNTENSQHLQKLINSPLTVPEGGIDEEFEGAIHRLKVKRGEQRIDELLEKSRHSQLSTEEESELNRVLAGK